MAQEDPGRNEDLEAPKIDFNAPPPYEANNTIGEVDAQSHGILPTYEEVQIEKSRNGEWPLGMDTHVIHMPQIPPPPPPNPLLNNLTNENSNTTGINPQPRSLTFLAINSNEANALNDTNSLLGTDLMFLTAFVIAFLFNWIGFLLLTCFCHTIAARYGALSGFGLSLAKWTYIVKHTTELASMIIHGYGGL